MKFLKENLMPILFAAVCIAVLFAAPENRCTKCMEEQTETTVPQTEATTQPEEQTPQTLLEEEGILVQYCGIDLGDPNLLLSIENQREEAISFYVDDFAINGCAVSIHNTSENIEPGAVYNTSDYGLSFDLEDLAYYNVGTVEDISFLLSIYDEGENSYSVILDREMRITLENPAEVHVEPIPNRGQTEETVLVDTEDAYVAYRGIESGEYSWCIDLYVDNRSSDTQWWQLENVRINGCYTMIWNDPQPISAGLKYRTAAYHDAVFHQDELLRYGVTEISTLDFVLRDLDGGYQTTVHIDAGNIPISEPPEYTGAPAKKHIYKDTGLEVFFCGFDSIPYFSSNAHHYFMSLRAETADDRSADIRVQNLRIDGEPVELDDCDIQVPRGCIYQSEATWSLDFLRDAWDEAGAMEYKTVTFDMIVSYAGGETTIPVTVNADELK